MSLPFLPIQIEELHEVSIDNLIVEGRMLEDFGFWKKGAHHILTFNFENGTCAEFNDLGELVNNVDLELKVKE